MESDTEKQSSIETRIVRDHPTVENSLPLKTSKIFHCVIWSCLWFWDSTFQYLLSGSNKVFLHRHPLQNLCEKHSQKRKEQVYSLIPVGQHLCVNFL